MGRRASPTSPTHRYAGGSPLALPARPRRLGLAARSMARPHWLDFSTRPGEPVSVRSRPKQERHVARDERPVSAMGRIEPGHPRGTRRFVDAILDGRLDRFYLGWAGSDFLGPPRHVER